ncbi:MAG: CBS domain-containing protein, partial [Chloroflexi bacterium]|nr:CBS domain-containing protein [Chloroflexota bacterium]
PLSPDITLEALVRNYILPLGLRCFPVVVDGAIQGVVSVPLIKKVPEESWPMVTVRAVTLPLEQVGYVRPADSLWMALNRMTSEQREQLPVSDGDGQFVGVLTYDQVMRFIQQHSRLRI